jgi:hypothetical protein
MLFQNSVMHEEVMARTHAQTNNKQLFRQLYQAQRKWAQQISSVHLA